MSCPTGRSPLLPEKTKKAGADVELVEFAEAGHFLPHEKVYPRMFEFFKARANDFAPDLTLARRTIAETVTEKPMSADDRKGRK
jgi:hypothetical protein